MHTPTQTRFNNIFVSGIPFKYSTTSALGVCLNLTRAHQAAYSEMISLYLLLYLYKGVLVHIVPLMNTPNGLPLKQHSLPFL